MTSTDVASINRRLPPLTGLLDDTLDGACRARRRRNMVAADEKSTLAALAPIDQELADAVVSASIYGDDADAVLRARIASSDGDTRDAFVYLRVALAVHRRLPLEVLIADYLPAHYIAVRDALWFHPVPRTEFDENGSHISALLDTASNAPDLLPVALDLAGRRAARNLVPRLRNLAGQPLTAEAEAKLHYALAATGAADAQTRQYISAGLLSCDEQRWHQVLPICAVAPAIAGDAELERALAGELAEADLAWAILTSRHPRMLLDHAMQRTDQPAARLLRLVAFTGFLDVIIDTCRALAERDEPATPAEADVLHLALGGVPLEVKVSEGDRASKSQALRQQLLGVLRRNHIGIRNDASDCPWEAAAILAKPELAQQTRLRDGKARAQGIPPLGACLQVTRALRQWLYIERAELAGHVLAMSPIDLARRQLLLLGMAEWADGMRA